MFPRDVLDEFWDLIESVYEGFPTYSFKQLSGLKLLEVSRATNFKIQYINGFHFLPPPPPPLPAHIKTIATKFDLCVKQVKINPGPEVIKLFSCSTQLSMKFFLLITVKMATIVGILTFMNRKNSIISLSEPKNAEFPAIFILMSI